MSNWVPSEQTQNARRALLEEKLLRVGGPLEQLAVDIGEDKNWALATRAHLLESGSLLTMDAFLQSPASEPWRHLWLGQVNGVHASIVALRGLSFADLALMQGTAEGLEGVQWVDKVSEISSVLGRYRVYMGWVLSLIHI